METVCGGKSGSVVVVMGTSVLEVSDSSCGEGLLWDCSLGIFLCLALHLAGGASCRSTRGVIRQAELDILHSYLNINVAVRKNHESFQILHLF